MEAAMSEPQDFWRDFYADPLFRDNDEELDIIQVGQEMRLRPQRKRKPRKPSLIRAIRAAQKAGVDKGTVTMPNGISVSFGESDPTIAPNPWMTGLDEETRQ
jgi:hypothetical protein